MEKYGTKLKTLIKESGYTLKEISEKIEVPASTIASWYKSEYPPLDSIIKICQFFKINLWEFFINDNEDLKKLLPGFISSEDINMLKLVNTKMDVEQRIKVKKVFLEVIKLALAKDEDKFKDLPEYKALFEK